jgi:hypothetical protein
MDYDDACMQVLGFIPIPEDASYITQTGAISATFNLTNTDANGTIWNIVVAVGTPVVAACLRYGDPIPLDQDGNPFVIYICSVCLSGIDPNLWPCPDTRSVAYTDSVFAQAAAQGLAKGILEAIPFTGTLTGLNQLADTPPYPPDLGITANTNLTGGAMLASISSNKTHDCGCGKKNHGIVNV